MGIRHLLYQMDYQMPNHPSNPEEKLSPLVLFKEFVDLYRENVKINTAVSKRHASVILAEAYAVLKGIGYEAQDARDAFNRVLGLAIKGVGRKIDVLASHTLSGADFVAVHLDGRLPIIEYVKVPGAKTSTPCLSSAAKESMLEKAAPKTARGQGLIRDSLRITFRVRAGDLRLAEEISKAAPNPEEAAFVLGPEEARRREQLRASCHAPLQIYPRPATFEAPAKSQGDLYGAPVLQDGAYSPRIAAARRRGIGASAPSNRRRGTPRSPRRRT